MSDRTLQARHAAHIKWSRHDAKEGTLAARMAFQKRFEREVDPEGVLPLEERLRRAEHAKKAYFLSLARRSAEARRRS
jgi:hypothetical protein